MCLQLARIFWEHSSSCFIQDFMFQAISERTLCSKDFTCYYRDIFTWKKDVGDDLCVCILNFWYQRYAKFNAAPGHKSCEIGDISWSICRLANVRQCDLKGWRLSQEFTDLPSFALINILQNWAITYSICHMTSQNHVTKGSYDFLRWKLLASIDIVIWET